MDIHGNLRFSTVGDGQLVNAVIERFAGGAGGSTLPANGGGTTGAAGRGRMVYNTDDNLYYFFDGTFWQQFGGGSGSALQQEVDNIEAASGGIFDTDGTYVAATLDNVAANIDTSTSLADAILQLDAAIEGIDTLAELGDTNISGSQSAGDLLAWDGTDSWDPVDNTLANVAADVTASAAELNYLSGVTANVETTLNNLQGFTGSSGDTDGTPTYSSSVYATGSLETAIGALDAQLSTVTTGLTTIDLGDLADVTDALSGTLVTAGATQNTEGDTYFFRATATDAYEVEAATLGSLNNVAFGVDSATTEDVLAYNGSAWTAITPATFAGDFDLNDIGDVTITTVAAGEVLTWTGAAWENQTLSEAGVQAQDALLDAIAAYNWGINPGIMVATDASTIINRTIVETTTTALTITNGDGVSGNPSIAIDATLDGIAALAPVANEMIYATAADTFAVTTITSAGRALIDDADASAQRTTLDVYSTSETDTNFVGITGDIMAGNLTFPTGYDVLIADPPSNATDAANKAYVDSQAGGLTWLDPVWFVDLVSDNITTSQIKDFVGATTTTGVTDAETSDMYIVDGTDITFTAIGTGGTTVLNTGGSGTGGLMTAGDVVRFDADDDGGNANPSWEYIGHMSDTAVFPVDAYWGVCTVTGATAAGTFAAKEGWIYQMTASATAGNNDATWAAHATHTTNSGPSDTETFLVNNPNSGNAFKQFTFVGTYAQATYPEATTNKWLQVGATASITAGIGLAFSGNTMNVNLGAGIVELPSDEVGLDIESGKGVQLTSTATGGLLTLVLDETTTNSGLTQSSSGLKLIDLSDTNIYVGNSSNRPVGVPVSGDIAISNTGAVTIQANAVELSMLEDGAGAQLIVCDAAGNPTYTTVTGDVAIGSNGTSIILAGAVEETMLAATIDHIGVTDGSTTTDVGLGNDITFAVGAATGLSVSESGGTITYSGVAATTTTLGVASFAAADFSVAGGAVSLLANSVEIGDLDTGINHVGIQADVGGSTDISLGNNFTIAGGSLTTTTNVAGVVTIDVAADLADLGDCTANPASDAAGSVMVSNATTDVYEAKAIQYIYSWTGVAKTSHTVNHALGQQFVNVTVFDSSNNVIIPQSITLTDANNVTVTFNTAIQCKVVVMGVPGVAVTAVS